MFNDYNKKKNKQTKRNKDFKKSFNFLPSKEKRKKKKK